MSSQPSLRRSRAGGGKFTNMTSDRPAGASRSSNGATGPQVRYLFARQAGFGQDLLAVLAERRRRFGDALLGEAELDRIGEGARHLGDRRAHDRAASHGLLVVGDV